MQPSNKNIFLITAFTPIPEKENLLVNLINKLKTTKTPIFLVSHTMPSSHIMKMVDYCLYDPENPNFYSWDDIGIKTHGYWWETTNDFSIQSSYNVSSGINHSLSALKMYLMGLFNVKGLGFEKCHVIEYDTIVSNLDEINENWELLDKYDVIGYNGFDKLNREELIMAQFLPINLNSYNFQDLQYNKTNKEKLLNIFNNNPRYNAMGETMVFDYFFKSKNYLIKNYKKIDNIDTIRIDESSKIFPKSNFCILPAWSSQKNCLVLYYRSEENITHLAEFIINNKYYFSLEAENNNWKTVELGIDVKDIKNIKILHKGKTYNMEFETELDYNNFINKSFIKYN